MGTKTASGPIIGSTASDEAYYEQQRRAWWDSLTVEQRAAHEDRVREAESQREELRRRIEFLNRNTPYEITVLESAGALPGSPGAEFMASLEERKKSASDLGIAKDEFWKMSPRDIEAKAQEAYVDRILEDVSPGYPGALSRKAETLNPASPRTSRTRNAKREELKILVISMRAAHISAKEMCDRLTKLHHSTPLSWGGRTWNAAFIWKRGTVDTYLSKLK